MSVSLPETTLNRDGQDRQDSRSVGIPSILCILFGRCSVSTKYAARSLLRQRRRTLLSVVGVAVGCASSLVTISWVRGEPELVMKSAAETGVGHLRIAPVGWAARRQNDLRVEDWRAELEHTMAILWAVLSKVVLVLLAIMVAIFVVRQYLRNLDYILTGI